MYSPRAGFMTWLSRTTSGTQPPPPEGQRDADRVDTLQTHVWPTPALYPDPSNLDSQPSVPTTSSAWCVVGAYYLERRVPSMYSEPQLLASCEAALEMACKGSRSSQRT